MVAELNAKRNECVGCVRKGGMGMRNGAHTHFASGSAVNGSKGWPKMAKPSYNGCYKFGSLIIYIYSLTEKSFYHTLFFCYCAKCKLHRNGDQMCARVCVCVYVCMCMYV